MKSFKLAGVGAGVLILTLVSCTNPYDPGQRAVGGGLIGAGAGAALGAAVGGGRGAATGALIGGAVGAITGAATTPPPPPPPGAMGYPPPPPGAMGYPPPPPPPARVAYRHCAPGWHFVRGHHDRWGRWIRPHCARNY